MSLNVSKSNLLKKVNDEKKYIYIYGYRDRVEVKMDCKDKIEIFWWNVWDVICFFFWSR